MLVEQVATHFDKTPQQIEHKLRLVESELFSLVQRYGVQTITELDKAVQTGQFHEVDAFEDYFRFDYLEDERSKLRTLLEQL